MNARLTQAAAAAMIYAGTRTWQQWEAGDRRMHPGLFELFLLKTGQVKLWETIPWETLPEIIQAKADVKAIQARDVRGGGAVAVTDRRINPS